MTSGDKLYVKGYYLISLLNAKKHKNNEKFTVSDGDDTDDDSDALFGLGIGIVVVLILMNIALWVWGLIALLKRQKTSNPLPSVALIFAILGLVGFFAPGGPVLTLILVYAVK